MSRIYTIEDFEDDKNFQMDSIGRYYEIVGYSGKNSPEIFEIGDVIQHYGVSFSGFSSFKRMLDKWDWGLYSNARLREVTEEDYSRGYVIKNEKEEEMTTRERRRNTVAHTEEVEDRPKSPLEELQSNIEATFNHYNTTSERVTEKIQFSSMDFQDAKEKLVDFVHQMQQMNEPKNLIQAVAKRTSVIPFVGSKIKKSYDEVKKQELQSDSAREIISNIYNGMKKKHDEVNIGLKTLFELREEFKSIVDKLQEHSLTVKGTKDSYDTEDKRNTFEYHTIIETENRLMKSIISGSDKIKDMNLIIELGRGAVTKISQNLPESKTDLINTLAINSSVSKIAESLHNINEMGNIMEEIDAISSKSIRDTAHDILEYSSVGEEDIKKMKKAFQNKIELFEEITEKMSTQHSNALKFNKEVTEMCNDAVLSYQDTALKLENK